MTAFRGVSATDQGRVRSSNQDLGLVSDDLVAVADGMGGHVGGEVAARVAIDALRRTFAESRTASGLVAATNEANRAVFDQSERESNLKGMGTTLTAAALARAGRRLRLVVTNVGDSRAYLLRDDQLVQITEDHSLVEEMVRNGELTAAEAAVHPHRHILTRALGIDRSVNVDSWEIDPVPGSRLLLCSDGLTNECTDEEIAAVLSSSPDPAAAASRLVAMALDHGGSDNVTVVVVDVDASAPSPAGEPPGTHRSQGAAAGTGAAVVGAGWKGAPAGARGRAGSGPGRATETRRQPAVSPGGAPRRRGAERVLSFRVVLFVILFVGVLGGAAGVVGWYVKASYFVGIDHGDVAVYEGRPGGFLWFKPQVLDRTSLPVSRVFPPNVPPLRAGMLESSFAAAEAIVANLANERRSLALPGVATTGALGVVGTTTTTLPPTTTTTKPPAKRATTTKPPRRATAGQAGPTSANAATGAAAGTTPATTTAAVLAPPTT